MQVGEFCYLGILVFAIQIFGFWVFLIVFLILLVLRCPHLCFKIIIFGFSILMISNFIPTIYFGIFTGLAMLLAMVSVLTLLPSLILLVKPFGK